MFEENALQSIIQHGKYAENLCFFMSTMMADLLPIVKPYYADVKSDQCQETHVLP